MKLKARKKICGVGINDADYSTVLGYDSNGKQIRCLIYMRWKSMIARCYNKNNQTKHHDRSYAGCTVDKEWLLFTNFKKWMESHPNWLDMEIDKDILIPGNTVYGPNTCLLVPKHINALLVQQKSNKYGPGVAKRGNAFYSVFTDSKTKKKTFKKASSLEELLKFIKKKSVLQLLWKQTISIIKN